MRSLTLLIRMVLHKQPLQLCQLKLVEVWEELLYLPLNLVLQQQTQQVLQLLSLSPQHSPPHLWQIIAVPRVRDHLLTVRRNLLLIQMQRNFLSILQLKSSLQGDHQEVELPLLLQGPKHHLLLTVWGFPKLLQEDT